MKFYVFMSTHINLNFILKVIKRSLEYQHFVIYINVSFKSYYLNNVQF